MKRLLYFIPLIFVSCSVSKQISKSANETVLTNKALTNAHVGLSIFEPATNKYWFNHQGDKYFVPASNIKIPTCYAAMKYLGDSLVGLEYQVNQLGVDIRPVGDPTFLHSDFRNQPVFDFLKKQNKIFFTRQKYIEPLGSGWAWNDHMETYMAPRSEMPIYGNIARITWSNKDSWTIIPRILGQKFKYPNPGKNGFNIWKQFGANEFGLTEGDRKSQLIPFEPIITDVISILKDTLKKEIVLGSESRPFAQYSVIHSQPTDSMLKPMMHRSDNFFAEQTLLMVSNAIIRNTDEDSVRKLLLTTDFKDLPQKPRWADGSGLSRYNLFTPQDFVMILNKMKNEFGMDRIKVILPTGGEGTISSYYKADSNYIFGKTGTLSGVVAFSGFMYTKKGKLLIFSTLVNNHQASATDVRRAIEKFLQGVRNHY